MKKIFLGTLVLFCTIFISSCEKKMTCIDFKEGTFLIANDTSFVKAHKVIRTKNLQTQISPKGDSLFAKIEWINDCSYRLKFDKSKMHMTPFHLNVNTQGGFLVQFKQPINNEIMPYVSSLSGKTKTETFRGFFKKIQE